MVVIQASVLVVDTVLVNIVESALVVAFDTLVVALTFYKTYQLTRQARSAGIRSGLGEVILRDGEYRRFLETSALTKRGS